MKTMKTHLFLVAALNALIASSAHAAAMEQPSSATQAQFTACNADYRTRKPEITQELCTAALAGELAPRQKTEAMVVLGYAYMMIDLKAKGFSLKSLDRTISIWREAAGIDETNPDPLIELASLYRCFMHPVEAEQAHQEAELRAPKNAHAFARHSLSLRAADGAQAELQTAEIAVALQPNESEALYAHGLALLANKHYVQAAQQLKRAVKHYDETRFDRFGLAWSERPQMLLASFENKLPKPVAPKPIAVKTNAERDAERISKMQAALQTRGYKKVTVTGAYDNETQQALNTCLSKASCKAALVASL
jgi:tetratricopeptide (TPR) repeat protein